jgi:hypothetical protein
MCLRSCPKALTGENPAGQHRKIAFGLIDSDGRLHLSTAIKDAVLPMPGRMDGSFCFALWAGESGRQRPTVHHCGAVRGIHHVRKPG